MHSSSVSPLSSTRQSPCHSTILWLRLLLQVGSFKGFLWLVYFTHWLHILKVHVCHYKLQNYQGWVTFHCLRTTVSLSCICSWILRIIFWLLWKYGPINIPLSLALTLSGEYTLIRLLHHMIALFLVLILGGHISILFSIVVPLCIPTNSIQGNI